jgi:ketosteroid isomerase-like protein
MTSSESEIRVLLDKRVNACRAKDIDQLMGLYAPDIVYYDVVPPVQFVGPVEVRRNFLRWFDEYEGAIGLETHDLDVATSGDVAFAHMLHSDSGKRKPGVPQGDVEIRSTVCCRRSGDTWLITHEHVSLPLGWRNDV